VCRKVREGETHALPQPESYFYRYRQSIGFRRLVVRPIAATAVDLDELTVVTLARDGSWGVATAASQGPAIAGAIRDCRAMAGGANDCGAQFATTRGGWVVAKLCGDHKIIVTAETRQAADQAALARELALKRLQSAHES
jgi:hypothetical protein